MSVAVRVCAASELRLGQVVCAAAGIDRCEGCAVTTVDDVLSIEVRPVGGGVARRLSAAPEDGYRVVDVSAGTRGCLSLLRRLGVMRRLH